MRNNIIIACTECKQRNYDSQKNKKNDPDRIEVKKYCNNNLEVIVARIQEPLYYEKSNPLVQKLCNIFNDYNNSTLEPMAIGGGTYARAFDNCISFGPQMPNAKDMCHQTDEYITKIVVFIIFTTKS